MNELAEKQHYSEADLLETYYMQPGESLPVMMHLADCTDCATRYERIERKVRGLAACDHDSKPETFWARQRISVMRSIEKTHRTSSVARVTRVAAAAVLALVLGGVITWNRGEEVVPSVKHEAVTNTVSNETNTSSTVISKSNDDSTDPWQSEELKEFGSMVEWESWVENGDKSL